MEQTERLPLGAWNRGGEAIPILELKQFGGPPPWLEFGRLRVGQKKVLPLEVLNSSDTIQEVQLDRITSQKGFSLLPGPDGTHVHAIPPGDAILLQVEWHPKEAGPVRESLYLKWVSFNHMQVVLHGAALGGAQAARGKPRAPLRATAASNTLQKALLGPARAPGKRKQMHESAGQPMSRLTASSASATSSSGSAAETGQNTPSSKLVKARRINGSTPDYPPRPAARTGILEEAEPQTPRCSPVRRLLASPYAAPKSPLAPRFTQMMGGKGVATIVTPAKSAPRLSRVGRATAQRAEAAVAQRKSFSHFHNVAWMEKQEKAFLVWLNSVLQPCDEVGTDGNDLPAKRMAARVRALLWKLYSQDEGVISVMLRLEKRIDDGFLQMREEQSQLGDVRIQEVGLEVLGSYHPFWLKLAMEIVVGKPVLVTARNLRRQIAELESFITEHFLNDAELAYERAINKTIDGLYTADYWAELGQMVLKRFLLFALLLDRAMTSASLPAGVPLLFRKESRIKSSHEVVMVFLRERLYGEGDVMRHLAAKGFKLTYEQDPRTEFEFGVTNLAVDLRNGIRLNKLVELLTGEQGLVASTHFPADRRPLQILNIDAALLAVEESGCSVSCAAEDIVNGVRDKTLSLLWTLISQLQLPLLLNMGTMRSELQRIRMRLRQEQRQVSVLSGSIPASIQALGELIGCLFQWSAAVCSFYDIAVRNFTTSFADGSVLCILVHFYLPWYIKESAIWFSRLQVQLGDTNDSEELGLDSQAAEMYRAGVRANFEQLGRAVSRLGGVPGMLSAEDCLREQGPDEKAVIAYAAYLCARLLEVSVMERAAHTFQRIWRSRQVCRPGAARAHLQSWISAAGRVQRTWRAYRFRSRLPLGRFIRAGLVGRIIRVQALWRGRQQRIAFTQQKAAVVVLQAVVRGHLGRRHFHDHYLLLSILQRGLEVRQQMEIRARQNKLERVAVSLQRRRKGLMQVRSYAKMRRSAVTIQAAVRRQQAQARFQAWKQAAVVVQSLWRGRQARISLTERKRAALVIQTAWRGTLALQRFLIKRRAAVAIQAALRSHQQQKRFLKARSDVVKLQSAWRGAVARMHCQRMRAARTVQRSFRGFKARQNLHKQQSAAVKLQASWRGHVQRATFLKQRSAAQVVQKYTRQMITRRKYLEARAAVVHLQAHARGMLARCSLQRNYQAVVKLQSAWRGAHQRLQYRAELTRIMREQAATHLQSCWRSFAAQRNLQRCRAAAVSIQAAWRGFEARGRFVRLLRASVLFQSLWRGRQGRGKAGSVRAARTIQAVLRGHLQRRRLACQREAATLIQSHWRGMQQRRQHKANMRRVVRIQSLVRRRPAILQLQRARAAAVSIQRHMRGFTERQRLARKNYAAQLIQSNWRGRAARLAYKAAVDRIVLLQAHARTAIARRSFQALRNAAIMLQSAWRVRQARLLVSKIKAAIVIQKTTKGYLQRIQLARMNAAAVKIQVAWLGYRQRAAFATARRAATHIQAAWKGLCAWREFQDARSAAITVQAHWRGFAARATLRKTAAAVTIQRQMRGWHARRQLSGQHAAATYLQAKIRMHLARKKYKAVLGRKHAEEDLKRAMREFAKAAKAYSRRVAATIKLQAFARGFLARKLFGGMRAIHHAKLAAEHARQTAALALIEPWAIAFKDRTTFLRKRRAVRIIQKQWRGCYGRKNAAAIRIQAAAKAWLAKKHLRAAQTAATTLQAFWRGYWARRQAGPRMKGIRQRLRKAAAVAARNPHKQIGARTDAAVQSLLKANNLSESIMAVAVLATTTACSTVCCQKVAIAGCCPDLLNLITSMFRSGSSNELLRNIFVILGSLSRHPSTADAVLQTEGCIPVLAAQLQAFRDTEEVFMRAATIFVHLLRRPGGVQLISRNTAAVKQICAVYHILARKLDSERSYLARLEGQKGSDVSAREATRKIVAASRQLGVLQSILASAGVQIQSGKEESPLRTKSDRASISWAPRNTLVRDALNEIGNCHKHL